MNAEDKKKPGHDSICSAMLADMESLKGMIYGAKQMVCLSGFGGMTDKQVAYSLQSYCDNAKKILEKWHSYQDAIIRSPRPAATQLL